MTPEREDAIVKRMFELNPSTEDAIRLAIRAAYAQGVAQERERAAKVCEEHEPKDYGVIYMTTASYSTKPADSGQEREQPPTSSGASSPLSSSPSQQPPSDQAACQASVLGRDLQMLQPPEVSSILPFDITEAMITRALRVLKNSGRLFSDASASDRLLVEAMLRAAISRSAQPSQKREVLQIKL